MASNTDYLRLGEHKIFQNLRETLPPNAERTKSVLAASEDMLYTWNFQDNCVLALNVKAARSREGDDIKHQKLMPMTPPLFTPEKLITNPLDTLLVAFGPNGVFVFELPERTPPYGSFANNKELVYCRVHSLHEQALAFSTVVVVKQVRFHPGSINGNTLAFLTSNNLLRLYEIKSSSATCVGVYSVGAVPSTKVPSSRISLEEALGETAVDFDFGPVEKLTEDTEKTDLVEVSCFETTVNKSKAVISTPNRTIPSSDLAWPIYVLYGNGEIYIISVILGDRSRPGLKGPHRISPLPTGHISSNFCSILCIPSTPAVLVAATSRGHIYHVLVLPADPSRAEAVPKKAVQDMPLIPHLMRGDKELLLLESMEVELGLNTTHVAHDYSCPVFLYQDDSKLGNYFATHDTGVHSISIACVEKLHKFLNTEDDEEILHEFVEDCSNAEYLLCTKTTTMDKVNPVIGFAVHHDPHSILVLLGDGQFVSLPVVFSPLPQADYLDLEDMEIMSSPLKKMLSNPFDAQIQRILKQSSAQPILKLASNAEPTQQECYELLQRASQVFRDEHFVHHNRAREEIEKRVKALRMLKEFQISELDRMMLEKQVLQEKAESLAEKYEDMKDKQENLTKRCEQMLKSISKRQTVPSNAEKQYHNELMGHEKNVNKYANAINKLKQKIKYQEVQMQNWETQNKKNSGLGSTQAEAIRSNLQNTTEKIAQIMKEINDYKQQLNITH